MNKTLATNPEVLSLDSPHFRYTPEGLFIEGKPTFEQCETEFNRLKSIEKIVQFVIGDLLNYMESRFGESYAQVLDGMDYALGSLANMKSVSKAFPPSRRREEIPFSYYAAIQSLPVPKQEELLDKIESGEITALAHLRNKTRVLKKQAGKPEAECLHEYMTVCKFCGKDVMEIVECQPTTTPERD